MRLKYVIGHILKLWWPHRHPQYVHPKAQNSKILKIFENFFLENKKCQIAPYAYMYGVVVQGCQSSILSESFETKKISKILKKIL